MRRPIRMPRLREKLGGCHTATVWRRVQDGTLPKPTKIGGLTVWDEDEIDAAIDAAFKSREAPDAA